MSDGADLVPGYCAPVHRSLGGPILLGGAPRAVAILNGTLAGAIGLGLRLWLAGIGIWAIGHALGVWAARKQRDPPFAGDHEGGTFGDQDAPFRRRRRNAKTDKIGRAACRERVCQYV